MAPFDHLKTPWEKGICIPWLITIIILYIIPSYFDMYPSSDSYLGGIGPLGIWGTLILTVSALVLSIGYSYRCVSDKTVYRCAGWGCSDETKGADGQLLYPARLVYPEMETPEETTKMKEIYNYHLEGTEGYNATTKGQRLAPIPSGWTTHHPWSEYNRKLSELNKTHFYKKKETSP